MMAESTDPTNEPTSERAAEPDARASDDATSSGRMGRDPFDRDLDEVLDTTKDVVARTTDAPRDEVEELVDESADRYEGAPMERFVPTLVERDVRRELRERGRDEARTAGDRTTEDGTAEDRTT